MGGWPRALDCSKWAVGLTVALLLINIGVPVWAMLHSLHHNPTGPQSLDLLGTWEEHQPQISGTFTIAAEAGIVAVLAALSAGGTWIKGSLALTAASFLVGGQILAIALIRIFNRPGLAWAYDISVVPGSRISGDLAGWRLRRGAERGRRRGVSCAMWRMLTARGALHGGMGDLAAGLAGAAGRRIAGGAPSMAEVPATVLLMPQNPQVITTTLMTWVHSQSFPSMIRTSLFMMLAVLVPALAAISLTALGIRGARWARRK